MHIGEIASGSTYRFVVREAFKDDFVSLVPLFEHVRPGTQELRSRLLCDGCRHCRWDYRSASPRRRECRWDLPKGFSQIELEAVAVHLLKRWVLGELAPEKLRGEVEVAHLPVQRGNHIVGVQR